MKDKESEKLWKSLYESDKDSYCCSLLKRMIEEGFIELPFCSYSGESAFLGLNYCPDCGKKL